MEFWRRNLNDVAARYRDQGLLNLRLRLAGDRMLQAENYVKRLRELHEPKDYQHIL